MKNGSWKNQYTKNKNRCQEKARMILTRILRIWAQCKEHRHKKAFLFFKKLKIKLKIQEKQIQFTAQHSRPRKDN